MSNEPTCVRRRRRARARAGPKGRNPAEWGYVALPAWLCASATSASEGFRVHGLRTCRYTTLLFIV
eukprot:COSAG02_NODE_1541_length_12013_cov_16.409182_10_plen_66_part_00